MGSNHYSFKEVKTRLATIESIDEKILFLQENIFDYHQHPPEYISRSTPFDKQCEMEIERLKKKDEFDQKRTTQMNNHITLPRLPINGKLKPFCDVFYRLMTARTPDNKRILDATIAQVTEMICNTYCEADGTLLNPATIRTYLSTSKADSRPKSDNEI